MDNELTQLKTRVALLEKMVLTLLGDQQENEQKTKKQSPKKILTMNRIRRQIM